MEKEKKLQKYKRKWSVPKGQYGYMAWGKKFSALRTVFYFALSAAIFAMGWISTGNKMNLLTVLAILGVLPASKSAVNMIMYLRNKGCSAQAFEQIEAQKGNLCILYDLAMTTYHETYLISSLAVKGHTVCGYTQDTGCDESAAQKHIEQVLRIDGHKDITVKIMKDLSKYTARLEQLNRLEEEAGKQMPSIAECLLSVSL